MFSSNFNNVLDRMFTLSRAADEAARDASWNAITEPTSRPQLWLPPVDICETRAAFVVEADLPGVYRENVDIQFDRGALTVTGTRAATLPAKEKAQLRVYSAERLSGSFSRSVRLPERVDAEEITATFSDGVLTVTVPKAAGALPRKITIAAGAEQPAIPA